ncbi:MAG: hypothetical protein JXB03_05630 [Spirochaetales bacterium]|nr:hypothetical protein [Spirochaetales bacterium]
MNSKMKDFIPAALAALVAGAGMILVGIFYYWVFSHVPISAILRGIIILATLGGIAALAFVTYERFREIHEEDQDDLGKY